MPGRKFKRQQPLFQTLLDGYRSLGPAHSKVAKLAGVSANMAQRAYEEGWPEFEWAPPIQQLLELEGRSVRSKLEFTDEVVQNLLKDPDVHKKLRDEVRKEAYAVANEDAAERLGQEAVLKERATLNALKTREEEAEVARLMRGRGRLLMSAGSSAMPEFMRMGSLLGKRMKLINDVEEKDLPQIDPHDLILLMTKYTDLQLKIALLVQAAQVIDRKAAGDPDFILQHQGKEMSVEDAMQILASASNMGVAGMKTSLDPEPGASN